VSRHGVELLVIIYMMTHNQPTEDVIPTNFLQINISYLHIKIETLFAYKASKQLHYGFIFDQIQSQLTRHIQWNHFVPRVSTEEMTSDK